MGYEIYIWPNDNKATLALDDIINGFNAKGLPTKVKPDEFGHWLVFDGYESTLNLDVKDGRAKGGGMKLSAARDTALLDIVVEVFRELGWAVGDDEGELE
jgi:hypothetical protein